MMLLLRIPGFQLSRMACVMGDQDMIKICVVHRLYVELLRVLGASSSHELAKGYAAELRGTRMAHDGFVVVN